MAKKKSVEFKILDGMKPVRLEIPGRPWALKAPLAVRDSRRLRLGVSCELPVLVVKGNKVEFFAPNQELAVDIADVTGAGEVVARAFVVDCSDIP